MRRLLCLAAAPALMLAAAALAASSANAVDDEVPTIKKVMAQLHKGAKAPMSQLKAQLKADTIPWADVKKETKDFVILGASLAKNDPPKGDKAEWKEKAEAYFKISKEMDDAAAKEDKDATSAAFKKLGDSCKACHAAHKKG